MSMTVLNVTLDFVGGYSEKDMEQKLMLVARDNRKKLQKDLSKSRLKI